MAVRLRGYKDFRAYLKAYYLQEKRKDPAFSYGAFAKRAGIANRGHLNHVIAHGRRLSDEALGRYVKALRLGEKDASYFRLLVAHGQAQDAPERDRARAALARWCAEHETRTLNAGEWGRAPDPWLLQVVHAMADLKDFRADPRWISKRLVQSLDLKEIRRTLEYLFREGYLERAGRKVRVPKGLSLVHEPEAAGFKEQVLRGLLDKRILRRDFPYLIGTLALTRDQRTALHASYYRWFEENVLGAPSGGPGEELHQVLWAAYPLTSGAAKTR